MKISRTLKEDDSSIFDIAAIEDRIDKLEDTISENVILMRDLSALMDNIQKALSPLKELKERCESFTEAEMSGCADSAPVIEEMVDNLTNLLNKVIERNDEVQDATDDMESELKELSKKA